MNMNANMSSRPRMTRSRTSQTGVALVIGMIFLVLLTLLVVSAINSSSVNLRIT
jgi:Tfp pilus assembly protein PilX